MNNIPTIDLRAELLDRHAGAIKGLYRLSTQIPIEKMGARRRHTAERDGMNEDPGPGA